MSQPENFYKEETKMKLYGAIDLHSTNNVTVVIDEQDEWSTGNVYPTIWH